MLDKCLTKWEASLGVWDSQRHSQNVSNGDLGIYIQTSQELLILSRSLFNDRSILVSLNCQSDSDVLDGYIRVGWSIEHFGVLENAHVKLSTGGFQAKRKKMKMMGGGRRCERGRPDVLVKNARHADAPLYCTPHPLLPLKCPLYLDAGKSILRSKQDRSYVPSSNVPTPAFWDHQSSWIFMGQCLVVLGCLGAQESHWYKTEEQFCYNKDQWILKQTLNTVTVAIQFISVLAQYLNLHSISFKIVEQGTIPRENLQRRSRTSAHPPPSWYHLK